MNNAKNLSTANYETKSVPFSTRFTIADIELIAKGAEIYARHNNRRGNPQRMRTDFLIAAVKNYIKCMENLE